MRILLFLLLILMPSFAAASDGCHDLWFTRNLIMDRAGYCFGSPLGKAVFDNSDCSGKSISLDARSKRLVGRIQSLEKQYACAVDTKSERLEIDDLFVRFRLVDLPVAEEFPGGCLGWLGPETTLYTGRSSDLPPIGRIGRGDYVGFFHVPEGGWTYVTVADPGWVVKGGGWMRGDFGTVDCRDWAG